MRTGIAIAEIFSRALQSKICEAVFTTNNLPWSQYINIYNIQYKAKKEGKNNFLILGHEKEVKVMDFSVENTIEQAIEASEKIRENCIQNNISSSSANIIINSLTTEELCTNTAKFAYGEKSKFIDIFLRIFADKIILKAQDKGAVFNPTEYTDESGQEVYRLKTLNSLPAEIIYNRVIGFNTTLIRQY